MDPNSTPWLGDDKDEDLGDDYEDDEDEEEEVRRHQAQRPGVR